MKRAVARASVSHPPAVRRFVRIVALLLDAFLLLLFCAGYAACYLQPDTLWWLELIAIGVPYLSLALLAVGVGAALARRWKLVALHLLLLGFAGVRFFPFGLGGAQAREEGDLTILTFNVPPWVGPSNEGKAAGLLTLAQAEQPDLMCFQETSMYFPAGALRGRSAPLMQALVDSLSYHVVLPEQADYTPQPVLVRIPGARQTQKYLRQEEVTTYVTRTQLRWQGRDVALYNLHLRSFGEGKPWDEEQEALLAYHTWKAYFSQFHAAYLVRAREAEQIRAMLDQEALPVIVCGDLNSTQHNWVYAHLAKGLQDAFKIAGKGWGGTYHAHIPFARIDFVLASPEWEVLSAHVPDVDVSDHRPLVVRLRWRE